MKKVILILAVLAFTQINAQDVETIYLIESVSVSNKDGDTRSALKEMNVRDLVSNELTYNRQANGFLMPTISSGVIPILISDLVEEVDTKTGLISNFNARYTYNNKTSDCNIYILKSKKNELVFFFETEHIIIAYKIVAEQAKSLGRIY